MPHRENGGSIAEPEGTPGIGECLRGTRRGKPRRSPPGPAGETPEAARLAFRAGSRRGLDARQDGGHPTRPALSIRPGVARRRLHHK